MPTRARLLAGVVFVAVAAMAVPPATVACSCAQPGPLASYATEPGTVVVAGLSGPLVGTDVTFEVERWYAGEEPSRILLLVPGNGADCGLPVQPGQHLIFVAWRDSDRPDRYHPSLCSPFGEIGTEAGDALVAEAEEAFGGVEPAPSATPQPQAPYEQPSAGSWGPWAFVFVAGAIGLGVLVMAAAVVLGRRGRSAP